MSHVCFALMRATSRLLEPYSVQYSTWHWGCSCVCIAVFWCQVAAAGVPVKSRPHKTHFEEAGGTKHLQFGAAQLSLLLLPLLFQSLGIPITSFPLLYLGFAQSTLAMRLSFFFFHSSDKHYLTSCAGASMQNRCGAFPMRHWWLCSNACSSVKLSQSR